jgi:hypothetical protein
MHRHEATADALSDALNEAPVCGRPEGHAPPCRSETSLRRRRRADMERWDDYLRERRNQRRRAAAESAREVPRAA